MSETTYFIAILRCFALFLRSLFILFKSKMLNSGMTEYLKEKKVVNRFKTFTKIKVGGLSLIEVITVVIIIGVISSIVVTNLSPTVIKTKVKEARFQLNHLHTLEQGHFYEFSKYSGDLQELGFGQLQLTTEGGQANYKIEIIESSVSGYRARASSVVDFDQDGILDVWEMDQTGKITNTVPD